MSQSEYCKLCSKCALTRLAFPRSESGTCEGDPILEDSLGSVSEMPSSSDVDVESVICSNDETKKDDEPKVAPPEIIVSKGLEAKEEDPSPKLRKQTPSERLSSAAAELALAAARLGDKPDEAPSRPGPVDAIADLKDLITHKIGAVHQKLDAWNDTAQETTGSIEKLLQNLNEEVSQMNKTLTEAAAGTNADDSISKKLDDFSKGLSEINKTLTRRHEAASAEWTALTLDLSRMKESSIQNRKAESLEWAFSNADQYSFIFCYGKGNMLRKSSTTELARKVVLNFRRGHSCFLPDGWTSARYELESQKEFRDKFVDQIHMLTGVKPRLEFNTDKEAYEIFYN